MKEKDIIKISVEVLRCLSKMGYEKGDVESEGQLIFPMKTKTKKDSKEIETENRISEQELRQLFIEVFKEYHTDLHYSIETPTKEKYSFGKKYEDIEENENGQSALLDMCIFKRDKETYNRILNIEFKHGNAPLKDIAKDVLKLMYEKQKGVFIFLLNNTNKGSLNNILEDKMGVLDKLSKSFKEFYNRDKDSNWNENENEKKSIHIIILSLERKKNSKGHVLIHRTLVWENLVDLTSFFSMNENGSGNITEVSEDSGWKIVPNK